MIVWKKEMINWQKIRGDSDLIIINLLLTMACNFECGHYMTDKVLAKVRSIIREIQSHDIPVTINLIGGEPTLKMKRFAEILQKVMEWDVEVEMTTNGWWMHKDKTALEFFDIVQSYIHGDSSEDYGSRGFTIRVSNDHFHDASRPDWLAGNRLVSRLKSFWESGELWEKEQWWCQDCFKMWDRGNRSDPSICPQCRREMESDYTQAGNMPPEPLWDSSPWIYVEDQKYSDNVLPAGRGKLHSTYAWNFKGCSESEYRLSFNPKGHIMDICCRGSNVPIGTVDDPPLLLLDLARRYKAVVPNCHECLDFSHQWMEYSYRGQRALAIREMSYEEEDQ
jgi:hypothetical protein